MDMKKWILPVAIMVCLGIMPFFGMQTEAANPDPFFTVSILAPNSNAARNQWSTLMVEQLPKLELV